MLGDLRSLPVNTSGHEAADLVLKTVSGHPIELARLPRIRLYGLHHTAATLALAAGAPPKVVSEQLGRASAGFTLDTCAHQ